VEEKFIAMGFDRVYPPGTDPKTSVDDINKDLASL
jgi:methylaspartate mutase sigma subunit